MNQEISYTCKFCGTARSFECAIPDDPIARFDIEKMKEVLTCNRCADHENERRKMERAITSTAFWLYRWREQIKGRVETTYSTEKAGELRERLDSIESRATEILTLLTKKFANCVCRFKGKTPIWDSDFVSQIFEKPEFAQRHLNFYTKHMA